MHLTLYTVACILAFPLFTLSAPVPGASNDDSSPETRDPKDVHIPALPIRPKPSWMIDAKNSPGSVRGSENEKRDVNAEGLEKRRRVGVRPVSVIPPGVAVSSFTDIWSSIQSGPKKVKG
ncbi:hypothetical protein B0O99DRAFT_593578 [Bisporella sp. PMI_857]|nr:hypothetical protein B0O99DRAFT_593578 [Bisporella sp. PMI_857]